MKKLIAFALATLSFGAFAQIKNPKFSGLEGWYTSDVKGAAYDIDSASNSTHRTSLKLIGSDPGAVSTFSQRVGYTTGKLKVVTLSAEVKTVDVVRGVSLWCQIWDGDKQIAFSNSNMQLGTLTGDNNWRKMSIDLILPAETRTLVIGGYLLGKGISWITDVSLNEKNATASYKDATVYTNEIKQLIKDNSLYKDSIEWNNIEEDLAYINQRIDSTNYDLINQYYTRVLRNAGDIHSFFQNRSQAKSYANGNTVALKPESNFLDGKIAYIKVPAFGSVNTAAVNNFADTIQKMIRALDEQNPKGWIVDLRGNTGGNMYPMIAGLGPLTGTGKLGYFVGAKKNAWSYEKGASGMAKVKSPYQLKMPNTKISVLIDQKTASSGEMTAVSFIGKPNVKLFGQPSAGYITANQSFKLSNGGMLLLATTFVSDRNNKIYLSKIDPDFLVETSESKDLALLKATEWLSKNNENEKGN